MVKAKKHTRWTMPLVVAVFLLATVFQLLSPALVYAGTAEDIHDQNYKYYAARFIRDCLFNLDSRFKNSIAQVAINNGTWLTSNHQVNIGRYFEHDDGVAGCGEAEIVNTAMKSLVGSNMGDLLLKIGYTKQGDNYIRPASGDTMNTTIVDKTLQRDYAKYVALKYIFDNDTSDRGKCELIEPPTGKSPAQVTYKKVVLNDKGEYEVQDTKAEFATEYAAGSTKVNYDYKAGARNSATCRQLLAEMDGLVGNVVQYNNSHKDDPITDGLLGGGQEECNSQSPTWNAETKTCGSDEPTCTDQVKGIGWLICPTMEFLANINDMAYGVLASNFLQIDTGLVKGAEAPWAKFKDLANIAFVIALLFVIYSQVTSVGISNYGIKKMLPKIIVAALLVNLSFIICQIAVDLSNILGYGISRFFTGLEVGATLDSTTQDKLADKGLETLGTALNWSGAIGLIMVAGVSIAMAVSFPVVLSALLALAMIVLILLARKALIVLLIVIAPLAFVAYLLPNTEQWFKKWAKMFSTLLLLFPIIGVVFGASALAAKIVATAGGNKDDPDPLIQLAALAISALPFFVVPGLLKGAINAAGALGTKLSGLADRAGKSAGSSARKKSKERFDNSYMGRNLAERKKIAATRRAMIAAGTYTGRNPLHKARSAAFGALNSSRLSGKAGDKMATMGAALQDKEFQEEVSAITSSFNAGDHQKIIDVATGKAAARSDAHRVAAIQYAAKSGSASDIAGMEVDKDAASSVKNAAISAFKEKKIHNLAGNGVLSEIATKGTSQAAVDKQIVDRLENGQISAESFVQSESTTKLLGGSLDREHAKGHKLTQAGKARVQKVVNEVYSNESTKKAVQGDVEQGINDMGSVLGRP